jgi:predicted O-methyltransferase YrrM
MTKIIYDSQLDYLSSLRTSDDPLIKEMEDFASKKGIPILDWKAAEFLEQLISTAKPKRVLEIGMAIAYSSIRIARRLQENASLDTIEKSMNNIRLAEGYLKRAKLNSSVNILKGDALEIIPILEHNYDFIFLDADKRDYERLFHYSLMLLKKGGIIFIDNLLWHGYAAAKIVPASFQKSTKLIREFNKVFSSSSAIQSTILPIGDGIGFGVKIIK